MLRVIVHLALDLTTAFRTIVRTYAATECGAPELRQDKMLS